MNAEKEKNAAAKLYEISEKYFDELKEISKELDMPLKDLVMAAINMLPTHLLSKFVFDRILNCDKDDEQSSKDIMKETLL